MKAVFQVTLREWRWIRRDFRQVLLVVLAPLAFVTILSLAYSPKKVVGVPVLIVDQDHSAFSRALTSAILANETFSLGGYADSADEFPSLVARDQAHLCLVFPRGLEQDIKARRGAKVLVMVDASNSLSGRIEISNAINLLGTFSVGAETRMIEGEAGISQRPALKRALPIQEETRSWFNPGFTSNYLNFLALGMLCIPVQLAALTVSIGSGAYEYREWRTDPILLVTRNPWTIMAGKILAYVAIIYPVCVAVIYTPHILFGAPMSGSQITLAVVTLWFTAMLATLGYALSCVLADPLFATEICALITLPNFVLTGFTWPLFAMPNGLLVLSYGMPMYCYSFMYRKLSVMGASIADCWRQLAILSIWTLLVLLLARFGTGQVLKSLQNEEAAHG
jgi:ABC-2 type transport system permease protein